MTKKLILDVDTGTDDAIALMFAALHSDFELIAATTVNGNNPLANCTENTLRLLDYIGSNVPVYEGMATPIARPRRGFQDIMLPIPRARSVKQSQRAVEFLVETYMASTEPIALVPVGPLTNIAMAIKLEPRIVDRIPETIIMGGGHEVGNCGPTGDVSEPSAEFNIWVDPEAARVVFGAGLQNVVVMPLDATHRALVSLDDCQRMRELGTPAGEAAAAFIEYRIRSYDVKEPMDIPHSAPVHDALCIAYLIDPTVVTGQRAHVDVETHGELTVGRTVIDTHGRSGKEPNAFVAFDADAPKFVSMLLETFARR